jgi:hypothetical protein
MSAESNNTESSDPKSKVDFISKELKERIPSFHGSVDWYRHVYFVTSMATLILSGLITVLAGWKRDLPPELDNAVLILSALITVVSGWGLFFSPKNSWLIYAATLHRLRALQSKMEFMKAPPATTDGDERFASEIHAEYQATLDAHNKAWLDLRSAAVPTLQDTPLEGRTAPLK